MIRKSLLFLAVLVLKADDNGFMLEGQFARERKGLDATYVAISSRDILDISWDASFGVVDPGRGRDREFRAAMGLGGFGPKGMGFLEAIAAGGGPWGTGVGLRMRGAWFLAPHVHVGWYAAGFARKTGRGEVGITAGFQFP